MAKFSKKLNITLLLFVILSTILIAVSCGGSDSSFINTNQNVNTPVSFTYTPTPALTSVPVNAYVYLSNTSLEDGENVEQTTVLDIPAVNPDSSGSTPLLTQLSALQQENPQDWQGEDMKELSDKLSATLKNSQVLPQTAKVFTVYQDSLNESPIPVNNEGYISGQAVVGDTDTNVQLEVSLDEDHYIDAETIIPSNNLTSSDATGATLKSCPEKVFVLPGEVIIIQITSTTGINLKEAGLTFSLKNPNLGCITSKPIFLEICGKKKYDKAYCLFYAKKNLTTPIDSVITAKTTTGLQVEIFTEIIKSCASISGKVFTTGGKPLIKGYVKSIGSKAFCKLDSSGSYTLPRVFCGHFRKIIATYWLEDNSGKKIRHREEKIIDYFNSNLTNFNFGEEFLTPTPTSTPSATPTPRGPWDSHYDISVSNVIYQFNKWEIELGTEQAIQKTINWLNYDSNLLNNPVPQGIEEAILDDNDNHLIWIYFTDGMNVCLDTKVEDYVPAIDSTPLSISQNFPEKQEIKKSNYSINKVSTVSSSRILILAPVAWEEKVITNMPTPSTWPTPNFCVPYRVYKELKDDLEKNGYEVDSVVTQKSDFYASNIISPPDPNELNPNDPNNLIRHYFIHNGSEKNIISPYNLSRLDQYGIIYIATHGSSISLQCGLVFDNDPNTRTWVEEHKNERYNANPRSIHYNPNGTWNFLYLRGGGNLYDGQKRLSLTINFFKQQHLNNSLVFIDACQSWKIRDAFNGAKVYLGYFSDHNILWARSVSYQFFYYMMYGDETPFISNPPMNVTQAYNTLKIKEQNPDLTLYTNPPPSYQGCTLMMQTQDEDIYFPVPVTITIEKK